MSGTASTRRVTGVRVFVGLESVAIVAGAISAQVILGHVWWLFVLCVLLPDIGIAAYLLGSRFGAVAYNALHAYAIPVALGLLGALTGTVWLFTAAFGWAAHIGIDRAVGYGFKYPDSFKDTHLQRI